MTRRAKSIPTAGENPLSMTLRTKLKYMVPTWLKKFLHGPASFWDLFYWFPYTSVRFLTRRKASFLVLYFTSVLTDFLLEEPWVCSFEPALEPLISYSLFHGLWQSFVIIGSCNHLMRIIFQRMSAIQRKVRSREDVNLDKQLWCIKWTLSYFLLVANYNRELKQTNAAAKRRRSTKSPFNWCHGPNELTWPWALLNVDLLVGHLLLTAAASVCLSSLITWFIRPPQGFLCLFVKIL